MAFTVFKTLSDKIFVPFNDYAGIAGQLIEIVMPIIVLVLTISIMWHGYETIRGKGGQNAFLDVFWKSVRTMLVVGLALTGGAYLGNVVGGIEDLQNTLSSIASGAAPDSNPFASLDASMTKAGETLSYVWDISKQHFGISMTDGIEVSGAMMILQALIMYFGMLCYAAVAAIELAAVTLALKIIFAFGPAFVACFAFPTTAKFFDSWLGAVLKYVLTGTLITMMFGVGNGIFNDYATGINAAKDSLDYLSVGGSCIGAIIFLIAISKKVSEIAASMLGGIAISATAPGVAGPLAALGLAALGGASRAGAYVMGNTAPGAALAEKAIGVSEKFANTGVGAFMQSVAGNKGFIESFHAGANRHLQKKASGGGAEGTGSVTGGERPVTGSFQGMMAAHVRNPNAFNVPNK